MGEDHSLGGSWMPCISTLRRRTVDTVRDGGQLERARNVLLTLFLLQYEDIVVATALLMTCPEETPQHGVQ